jgi:hypothetical protein
VSKAICEANQQNRLLFEGLQERSRKRKQKALVLLTKRPALVQRSQGSLTCFFLRAKNSGPRQLQTRYSPNGGNFSDEDSEGIPICAPRSIAARRQELAAGVSPLRLQPECRKPWAEELL